MLNLAVHHSLVGGDKAKMSKPLGLTYKENHWRRIGLNGIENVITAE
jgi:hypothetical protein